MKECIEVEKVSVNEILKDLEPILAELSGHPIREYLDRYNN